MTTSGTTSFNLEIDELIDEAFGRVGIGGSRSGFHLRVARTNRKQQTTNNKQQTTTDNTLS